MLLHLHWELHSQRPGYRHLLRIDRHQLRYHWRRHCALHVAGKLLLLRRRPSSAVAWATVMPLARL